MEAQAYINEMKSIQEALISYIDGNDEDYEQLSLLLSNIKDNKHKLKSFLYLIYSITCNHHRSFGFFQKIERVLLDINSSIKQKFICKELVKIFHNCKIILLFYLKEKVITIHDLPQTVDFHSYFYPEFEETLDNDQKNQCFQNFYKLNVEYDKETFIRDRQIGENHSYICSLIRKDSVDEFISYVNRCNLNLSTEIRPSLFETNIYLINNNNKCNLIKYSAFYGSMQIFNYLRMNDEEITDSLWFFAIHGNNADMIHCIEENQDEKRKNKDEQITLKKSMNITKKEDLLVDYLSESILCHHNNIAEYIKEKINNDDDTYAHIMINDDFKMIIDENRMKEDDEYFGDIKEPIFSSYNFLLFPNEIMDVEYLNFFCYYDYDYLVELFINTKEFDINAECISLYFLC